MAARRSRRGPLAGDGLGVPDIEGTAPPHVPSTSTGGDLQRVLLAADVAVAAICWLLVIGALRDAALGGPVLAVPSQAALATALTLAAIRLLGLHRSRVCADRRVARRRLGVAAALPALAFHAGREALGLSASALVTGASAAAVWAVLALEREVFEQWLRARRARGQYVRPVVGAGSFDEVARIDELLAAHPETGFRMVGWVSPEGPDAAGRDGPMGMPCVGAAGDDLVDVLTSTGATGILVAPGVAASPRFGHAARQLQEAGYHVQLWSGVWGVAARRIRTLPLAHEPFFYLEPTTPLLRHPFLKRTLDVVVATLLLGFAAPLLAVSALLIKWHDGGPVLFRQRRVGRNGEVFELRKLRTMVPDAEDRLAMLRRDNERGGPLFKLTSDPRVTPVGRVLRATSIDELPQLLDVLAGRLSVVGPRPALPSEVARFDEALLDRHDVRPGITGLWQAEARHNPSFDAYRHLDLFYVENWTVTLDLVILCATVRTVVSDTCRVLGFGVARRWQRWRHPREVG